MTISVKNDIEGIAKRVMDDLERIDIQARVKLDELNAEKDDLRPEKYTERRKAILDEAKAGYADVRKQYSEKVNELSAKIDSMANKAQPPASDPEVTAMLQMLTIAPSVSMPMLEMAAERVGADPIAQETLRQIAQRSGQMIPPGIMKTPEKHLRPDDIQTISRDICECFNQFFNVRENGYLPETVVYNSNYEDFDTTPRDAAINLAQRGHTAANLRDVGKIFDFGGNEGLQGEFAAIADAG